MDVYMLEMILDTQLKGWLGVSIKATFDAALHSQIKTFLTPLSSSQQGAQTSSKWTICQEAVYISMPTPLFNALTFKGKRFLISYGLSYFNQLAGGVQLWQPWQAGDVPTACFPSPQ